jgi:putative membrane protein
MVKPPVLSAEEHAQLAREIHNAEAYTAGEIYVVIAQSPDDFRLVPVLWAAMFALPLAWILHFATGFSATLILSLQVLGFVGVAAILSITSLRYRVVPPSLAADAAHRAALAQFMAHGIHLTAARTGVLIYVCMIPHRIEVVADTGIHATINPQMWQKSVEEIAAGARAGRLSDGLVAAIRTVGAVLAQHCPRKVEDHDELPNRIVETR